MPRDNWPFAWVGIRTFLATTHAEAKQAHTSEHCLNDNCMSIYICQNMTPFDRVMYTPTITLPYEVGLANEIFVIRPSHITARLILTPFSGPVFHQLGFIVIPVFTTSSPRPQFLSLPRSSKYLELTRHGSSHPPIVKYSRNRI